MKHTIIALALGAALPASAAPLLPGGTLGTADLTAAAISFGDPILLTPPLGTASGSVGLSEGGFVPDGSVQDNIYLADAQLTTTALGSSEGTGFVYEIVAENRSIGPDQSFAGATGFTVSGFEGYEVDVAPIFLPGQIDAPLSVERSADGNTLSFDILASALILEPGTGPVALPVLVRTDASSFASSVGTIDVFLEVFGATQETQAVDALRPDGPVGPSVIPLPAGLPLLALGLGALAVLRRARRAP